MAAALATAVQIVLRDEAASDRTQLLVGITVLGAFLATVTVAVLAHLLTNRWPRLVRALLCAVASAVAFIPATMFSFAIENRIIEGHIEAETVSELTGAELFWTLFGAMGMFTPTGLRYLLPWPMLAVFLAALFLFSRWPRALR